MCLDVPPKFNMEPKKKRSLYYKNSPCLVGILNPGSWFNRDPEFMVDEITVI